MSDSRRMARSASSGRRTRIAVATTGALAALTFAAVGIAGGASASSTSATVGCPPAAAASTTASAVCKTGPVAEGIRWQ